MEICMEKNRILYPDAVTSSRVELIQCSPLDSLVALEIQSCNNTFALIRIAILSSFVQLSGKFEAQTLKLRLDVGPELSQ